MNFEEFQTLIEAAAKETQHLSGGLERNEHIRKIIAAASDPISDDAIGFACLFLDKHVHLALIIIHELTILQCKGQPPIPQYYSGRIPVIQACWQYWALKEGYVTMNYNSTAYWVEDKYGNRGNWH